MRSIGVPENLLIFGERRNGGKPNSHASFILQAHFDEGAVVIYYEVPRKSVALEWQKDLFRFLPIRARRYKIIIEISWQAHVGARSGC